LLAEFFGTLILIVFGVASSSGLLSRAPGQLSVDQHRMGLR